MSDEHVEEIHQDEGFFDILTDPAHLAAEFAFEGIFFILSALYVKWKLSRRDEVHGHD